MWLSFILSVCQTLLHTIKTLFYCICEVCICSLDIHTHTQFTTFSSPWQAFNHSCGYAVLTIYFHKETSLIYWFWETQSSGLVPITKGKHGERNTAATVCFISRQQFRFCACESECSTVLSYLKWLEERIRLHRRKIWTDIFSFFYFLFSSL